MKKTLLLTIVIALMAVVFFGCNQVQPVSGDVGAIRKRTGAPAGSNITATAHLGGFFIRWDAAEDVWGYSIYRKTVKAGVVDEASFVKLSIADDNGGTNQDVYQPAAWYESDDVEHGAVYIFGIEAKNIWWGNSDIVWMEKEKAVTANYPAKDSKVPFLAEADHPKIAVEALETSSVKGATTNYNDQIKVTLTNLKPGYKYSVGYQTTDKQTPAAKSDWVTASGTIVTIDPRWSLSELLTGEGIFRGGNFNFGYSAVGDNNKARVLVTITPVRGSFEVTPPADLTHVDAKNSDQFLSGAVNAKK